MIRYLSPKILHSIDSESRRLKQGTFYRFNARVNKYHLTSNNADARVFAPIFIHNIRQISPKSLDFYLPMIQSCKILIRVLGGPPNLKSFVTNNIGQNYQHKITKIADKLYEIDALKAVQNQSNQQKITGDEDNVIIINFRYDAYDLGSARFLVDVNKIGNFGIQGISSLIKGKDTRYLAKAENVQMINLNSCEFKFIWRNAGQRLMITSDPYEVGINATALKHGDELIEL